MSIFRVAFITCLRTEMQILSSRVVQYLIICLSDYFYCITVSRYFQLTVITQTQWVVHFWYSPSWYPSSCEQSGGAPWSCWSPSHTEDRCIASEGEPSRHEVSGHTFYWRLSHTFHRKICCGFCESEWCAHLNSWTNRSKYHISPSAWDELRCSGSSPPGCFSTSSHSRQPCRPPSSPPSPLRAGRPGGPWYLGTPRRKCDRFSEYRNTILQLILTCTLISFTFLALRWTTLTWYCRPDSV